MEEQMIAYLQRMMNRFQREKSRYGVDDRIVQDLLTSMIACREMTEALIGKPVNLQKDGKVTVGF